MHKSDSNGYAVLSALSTKVKHSRKHTRHTEADPQYLCRMYKHSCGRDGGCVPLCVDLLCNNLSHLLLFLLLLAAWPASAFSFFFQALCSTTSTTPPLP